MRVVMLSAGGVMAEAALTRLIEVDCVPAALVVHQHVPGGSLPVLPQLPLARLAQAHGVAVLTSTSDETLAAQCRAVAPEVLLSVCFARRLPSMVIETARLAAVNAHTSTLPAWRGPDPVFWQLRQGADTIGLTLHAIAERMDGGAPVKDKRIDIDGVSSESELNRLAGRETGSLFASWIDSGAQTAPVPNSSCAKGRWWRQPRAEDYRIFPAWRCVHAERFMRIMAERQMPFRWNTPNGAWILRGPAGFGEVGDIELILSDGRLSCWRLEPAEQR